MRNNLIFLFFYSTCVFATGSLISRSEDNEKAKDLILALKFADVKAHQFNTTIEYSLNSVVCHTADAYTDGLKTYNCKLDNHSEIQGASAKVLYDALVSLKIPVDAAMSQTWVKVNHVYCHIEIISSPPHYQCRWAYLR